MNRISNFFIAQESNNFCPPILSYKAFVVYGLVLLIVRILLGAQPAQSTAISSDSIMSLINQERGVRNLTVLVAHSALVKAAAGKSQDMIDRDYFAHVDPDGKYVWPRITVAGYIPYKILGENLAVDFETSEGMIKAWLDSPTHRANLLHTDFVHQGLSALYGDYQGRYTNLTTSLFGTLQTAKVFTSPKPKTLAQNTSQVSSKPGAGPSETIPVTELTNPAPVSVPVTNAEAEDETKAQASTTQMMLVFSPQSQPASPSLGIENAYRLTRVLFTLFGLVLLAILAVDAVIVSRHRLQISRSYSEYHFTNFAIIVLVSILIWWW